MPLYPPVLLALPLYAQRRLPLPLQSVDLEQALVVHVFLSLLPSLYIIHPPYNLPLALFGLAACQTTLASSLLPHFVPFWVASVVLDVVFLLYRGSDASGVVVLLSGSNMLLKLVSAGAAASILHSQGALPDFATQGGGAFGSLGVPQSFLGVSLPGASSSGGHGDSVPGGYQSIYDEEEAVPNVRVGGGAPPRQGGGGGGLGGSGPPAGAAGSYQTVS